MCYKNALDLLDDASLLFENGRYARAVSLAVLAMEEYGKSMIIATKASLDLTDDQEWKVFWKRFRDHDAKIGDVLLSALIFDPESNVSFKDVLSAAENRIHIDAFGNVFPCTAASGRIIFSAGNLRTPGYTLLKIWRCSPLFQFIRRFHSNPPKKCQECTIYNDCMGGCRVIMFHKYGDVTIADPQCKELYYSNQK